MFFGNHPPPFSSLLLDWTRDSSHTCEISFIHSTFVYLTLYAKPWDQGSKHERLCLVLMEFTLKTFMEIAGKEKYSFSLEGGMEAGWKLAAILPP